MIRASSARQIGALIADLASDRAITRDGAVARLTVIGARASEPLTSLVNSRDAPPAARAAALRVFEATADRHGLDAALGALDDGDAAVAAAAVAALRVHLLGPRGAAAVDRLTAVALDRRRPASVRTAAVQSLIGLERSTVRPLVEKLRDDPIEAIAALAAGAAGRRADRRPQDDPAQVLKDAAVHGRLPADPEILRRALAREAQGLALPQLLGIVERVREREQTVGPPERAQWMAARAAAHVALARRNSRLALYDIRETLESAKEPLPVEFLAALGEIGDASCLESIAAAFAASRATRGDWWRRHLADAFRAIVSRERITRRHAVIRKSEKRWSETLKELWPRQ